MKKVVSILAMVLFSASIKAQVIVNGNNINDLTQTMDVWAVIKPFTPSECYFIDYGQDKFRPHFYDHKTQMISNKDGKKFEKGEWIKLVNYLNAEGWEQVSERPGKVGSIDGRVITFKRVKT